MKLWSVAILAALVLLGSGCSGRRVTEPTPEESSLTGHWSGAVRTGPGAPSLSLALTLVQSGAVLSGMGRSAIGFACIPELPVCEGQMLVSGRVRGPEVRLRLEHSADELQLMWVGRGQRLEGTLHGPSTGPLAEWSVVLVRDTGT